MEDVSLSTCPVPSEQQPINEYAELKESWFFRWATCHWRGYLTGIAWVWGLSWFISGPVAAASFPPGKYPTLFFLSAGAGASLFLTLALLRLYLGWCYVRDRLLNQTVIYEESGWYDGQTWLKPPEVLVRDQLIVSYQIQPIFRRLYWTFACLAVMVMSGILMAIYRYTQLH